MVEFLLLGHIPPVGKESPKVSEKEEIEEFMDSNEDGKSQGQV